VTPFRSIIKYLLDHRERRPVTLFYTSKAIDDFVFRDVFDRAQKERGIRTIYSITDDVNPPANWPGEVGRITSDLIRKTVPEYRDCIFYISGPRGMVDSFKDAIHQLGPEGLDIRTDYFPGLA